MKFFGISFSSANLKRTRKRNVKTIFLTLPFGAKTLPGAGAVRLPLPGVEIVEKTGVGSSAAEVYLVGGSIVPKGALTDGGDVELLVNGETRVLATLSLIPDAFSVAPGDPTTAETSNAEVRAALRAARWGDRLLLRGGDYGFARDTGNTSLNVSNPAPATGEANYGWGHGDWIEGVSQPIVIQPHEGETPLIWCLRFGNVGHLRLRNLTFRTGVKPSVLGGNSYSGADNAPLDLQRNLFDVWVEDCTVAAESPVNIDDGRDFIPSGIRTTATGVSDVRVLRTSVRDVYDGVNPNGPDFVLQECKFTHVMNDVIKAGGSPKKRLRILWNDFEKSVIWSFVGTVASVRFETVAGSGVDRCVVKFEAGQYDHIVDRVNKDDNRWVFAGGGGAVDAAMAQVKTEVGHADIRASGSGVHLDQVNKWFVFPFDAAAYNTANPGNEVALDTDIATAGATFTSSNAHADFGQMGSPGPDWRIIGNVFSSRLRNMLGDRVSNGFNVTRNSGQPLLSDAIVAGNILVHNGLNTIGLNGARDCLVAFNTLAMDPGGGIGSLASIGVSVGPNAADPTQDVTVVYKNLAPNRSDDGNAGVFRVSDAQYPLTAESARADLYAAFGVGDYVDTDTADHDQTNLPISGLYTPTATYVGRGHTQAALEANPANPGRPLIDFATHTYDEAGLLALRDALFVAQREPQWGGATKNNEAESKLFNAQGDGAIGTRRVLVAVVTARATNSPAGAFSNVTWGARGRERGTGTLMTLIGTQQTSGSLSQSVYLLDGHSASWGSVQADHLSGGVRSMSVAVMEVEGVLVEGAVHAGAVGSSGTSLSPSVTASGAGVVIHAVAARDATLAAITLSGVDWTDLAFNTAQTSSSSHRVAIGREVVAAAGPIGASATLGGGNGGAWVWNSLFLLPA